MTDSQLTKLAHELDNRGFGGYDITDVMACIRSVLRESKPAPTSICGRPYPCAYCDGIPQRYHEPEGVEKGGAKG
jgi:hypothetical protein